jgi:AcrR family transcriptional regulator
MARVYQQGVRAAQVEATKDRIFDAGYELLVSFPYDDVTLDAIAAKAGVSVQTVLRHVGSKEGLVRAGIERWSSQEDARRAAVVGDVGAIARVLAERYEELGEVTNRYVALSQRIPMVAEVMDQARLGHRDWLEEHFAPWLQVPPAERARRVAILFSATESYSWTTWRTTFGMTRTQAVRALTEHLTALVSAWPRGGETQ